MIQIPQPLSRNCIHFNAKHFQAYSQNLVFFYDKGLELLDIYSLFLNCFDLVVIKIDGNSCATVVHSNQYIECLNIWGMPSQAKDEYPGLVSILSLSLALF